MAVTVRIRVTIRYLDVQQPKQLLMAHVTEELLCVQPESVFQLLQIKLRVSDVHYAQAPNWQK